MGFSRVTVDADDYRVNQLPWEYHKKFTLEDPGEHTLEATNKDTFLYEPIVNVDVGKHLYNGTIELLYPLVNPGNDDMASYPEKFQDVYERILTIDELFGQVDKDALGYKQVRIILRRDLRVPIHYMEAYKENKRSKIQLTSTEIHINRVFPGSYTDAYGNDGLIKGCDAYYSGFEMTSDVEIPITKINKIPVKEYRKELIPVIVAGKGEVVIMVTWEWKEWTNVDPEWIIRAVFVGNDEGMVETINTAGWAVTRKQSWIGLDREIRLAGMGDKTLACTTSSVDKGTSQVFELRIDHDAFTMDLGSIIDPIVPGSIDEMLGRVPPENNVVVRGVMGDVETSKE